MIFIIPIVLGAVALGAAAFGVGSGVSGVSNMQEAEKIGKNAEKRYEKAKERAEQEWKITEQLAEEYGQLQIDVKIRTIARFIAFIERNGQKGSQDKRFFEGFKGFSTEDSKAYAQGSQAQGTAGFNTGGFNTVGAGAAAAAAAGAAAGQGTLTMVGLFGTASTGTAISGLSGAAAWNATLAWLGGGSLAVGGGGMALGTVVLGGIMAGPALAVVGFVLTGEGEKALTNAREYESKANAEIAKMEAAQDLLKQVQKRVIELKKLVENLNNRAVLALNELESKPFDRDRDAGKFQQLALLIKAMSEIMKTPILDSEGNLNPATENFREKYGCL
ncbi:hypothetical protein VB834_23145 [Limnoraphis robusta Tam1]|uniref:Uncharacterized protein n=1 Tax=Limnoraphis robusta CCNP1315 TaxID=3110306 RepID=A0ABU5U5Y2_9CYAN|nr:hypothetical protein [Limnoraphis robusta]MEA5498871.1 hypothetical protein [Limnoraphis robusta BA-68 BA1]MEA5522602.1 hypothetical protein [Limnoraphis robusta CCNP1315]MEA5541932.1 hypothetical protein [Limnoraphis robusta Tam1]MEA5546513.1 hypothetical protein [Limnoraphis robusta CCNP1324]